MNNQSKFFRLPLYIILILILMIIIVLVFKFAPKIQAGFFSAATQTLPQYVISPSPSSLAPTTLVQSSPTSNPINLETEQAATIRSQSICAQIWGSNIPAMLPEWLTTPTSMEDLYTEVKYVYLAGELIKHGYVNAATCPDGGLLSNGVSNTCGMEKAFNQVVDWQNQFDPEILVAAQQNLVPAELIKRLFAQETQFWPTIDFAPPAYGLANVTSPGIEPLFMWYPDIFQHTCIDLYSKACTQPYSSLPLNDRQNLRGYFISKHIHAYCPTCSHGIDLDKTRSSVDYFTKLIAANCYQINLLLYNLGFSPQSISYEDAWRLTLTNYTVGTGCVELSLGRMDPMQEFSWSSFTDIIDNSCSLMTSINTSINNITR